MYREETDGREGELEGLVVRGVCLYACMYFLSGEA